MFRILFTTARCRVHQGNYLIYHSIPFSKCSIVKKHQSQLFKCFCVSVKNFDIDLYRINLYDQSQDIVLQSLNNALNIDHLFSILCEYKSLLTCKHICQAAINLWNFQKVYGNFSKDVIHIHLASVHSKPGFHELCHLVEEKFHQIDDVGLTCLLMVIIKLGVKQSSNIIINLILECQKRCYAFNMSALSYLSVSVKLLHKSGLFLSGQVLHALDKKLDKIDDNEDLVLSCIIIENLKDIASVDIVQKLMAKIAPLYSNKQKPSYNASRKFVIPALILKNEVVSTKIFQHFTDSIQNLSATDLFRLFFLLQSHGIKDEKLWETLQERSEELLEHCVNPEDCISLAAVIASSCSQEMKILIEDVLIKSVHKLKVPSLIHAGYILKDLQCINSEVLQNYWEAVKTFLETHCEFIESFIQIYHRTVLSCSTRYPPFEDWVIPILYNYLQSNFVISPHSIAIVSQFLISFSREFISNELINSLKETASQFSFQEISFISSGIKISWKSNPNKNLKRQLLIICKIINQALLNKVSSIQNLTSLNQVIESLTISDSIPEDILDELMDKYMYFSKKLSPLDVYPISQLLRKLNYWYPPLIDILIKYSLQNQNLLAQKMFSLLRTCCQISYISEQGKDFLDACLNVFMNIHNKLYCHDILLLANSFSLFEFYPRQIVEHIFSLKFLEQLDQESTEIFGFNNLFRNRKLLMKYNRAICLDCPELEIPWFHEQYCLDFVNIAPQVHSLFHYNVYSVLCEVLKNKHFIGCNAFTPYYYYIPFEIFLSHSKQPLVWKDYAENCQKSTSKNPSLITVSPDIQKVAIIILPEKAYCSNVRQLQGTYHLKRRHLEIMGYKIVEIPYFEWNSPHMTSKREKQEYLFKQIFE